MLYRKKDIRSIPVKVDSTLYGELQVTDFENGAYEVTIPSDDVTLNVLTKEVQDETEN